MVGKNNTLLVSVVDLQGKQVHQWDIDWFELWGNAPHLQSIEQPKSKPGTHIHGAHILNNGDLVFNFEGLGLMRINACGNEVWKLPYRTHHSIYENSDQTLWVAGQINYFNDHPEDKTFKGPYLVEPTILQISPSGKILQEISLFTVLKNNDLTGLLHLSSSDNLDTSVSEDFLHLNDIEIFQENLTQGTFDKGDILVSLRNINTLLVLDEQTLQVKYQITGAFLRQHDPDFIDGNTISVYDNNNLGGKGKNGSSRIVLINAEDNTLDVIYKGKKNQAFYSQIMGKHQWLKNGNLLITESMAGRAFEINPSKEIVWEFFNTIKPGWIGIIEEAERLPLEYNEDFFKEALDQCNAPIQ